MLKRIVFSAVIAGCFVPAVAQSVEEMEKILLFFGVSSPEEVDSYDVESLCDLLSHPLQVNLVTPASLSGSGLLTPYQVASLTDYRKRHGGVMSYEELSAVDGFGKTAVEKLRPFISLRGTKLSADEDVAGISGTLDIKTGWKMDDIPSYGFRYKMKAGRQLSAGLALSRSSKADGAAPDAFTGNVCLDFRKVSGKILLGDFNARFGQGLALWNGLSLSGLSSPSSYLKRASGLTPSSSFTGTYSMRGAAADLTLNKVKVSAFLAVETGKDSYGLIPAVNLGWLHRNGMLSFTHYTDFANAGGAFYIPDMKTAFDMALCYSGTDVFAEAAYDWVSGVVASLAGVVFPVNEDVRLASMLRYYPAGYSSGRGGAAASTAKSTNEYGLSLSSEFVRGTLAADVAYFPTAKSGDDTRSSLQAKFQSEWNINIASPLKLKVRLSERLRSWGQRWRTEARADLSYICGTWNAALRADMVKSDGYGLLGYAEAGRKAEDISIYIRYGMFRIDDWDDRIYVYERDAPGSFNVPAYYGRGLWGALTFGWRCARHIRLYGRAALTSYPFMKSKKSGRAELKLQVMSEF